MRIVMVTNDIKIDRRILLEAESLIKQGNEVILLAGWEKDLPFYEKVGEVKIERVAVCNNSQVLDFLADKVDSFSFPTHFLSRFYKFAYHFMSRVLSRIFRQKIVKKRIVYFNPDIIHVHDLPQLKIGYLAKKNLSVPLIYDAHELYPEINGLTKRQKRHFYKMENKLIKQCNEVITVNEYIADKMAANYKISLPSVIYNAINPVLGEAREDLFRKKLGLSNSTKILLFQGWMSKTRGLQDLVKSMTSVDENIHLVLMGYGEIQEELEKIIDEHSLQERVHILDAVPQDKLMYWTRSADVGIIPYQNIDLNNYYCSPNKLFEFIQSQIPIIGNDLPFLRKTIKDNHFGIVANLDSPRNYAKAINTVFKNINDFKKYKQNLVNNAKYFSWDNEEFKLYNIYKKVTCADLKN